MSAVLQLSMLDGQRARKRPPMATETPEVERIFAHWVFMLGKNPKRCALGPDRRKIISKALALYDAETLELAIEGCAASAWHRGANDRDTEYAGLELILRDEAHIERFAELGERLREQAEADAARAAQRAQQEAEAPAVDPAAAAAARQRLRDLAAQLAGRKAGGR